MDYSLVYQKVEHLINISMIKGLHFIGVRMLCGGFVSTGTILCHLYIGFQTHHTAEYNAVQ